MTEDKSDSIALLRISIKALENDSDSLDSWLHLFVALVAIGVALEVGYVLWEFYEDRREYRQHRDTIRSPQEPRYSRLFLELVGAVLVTIGVGGELALSVKSGRAQTDLRTKNAELFEVLERQTAEAAERASNAEQYAAELLRDIQPRSLSLNQQREIGNAMRRFSGWKVLVTSYIGDLEGFHLAAQLVASLKYAKLAVDGAPANAGMHPSSGVLISCTRSNRDIARALQGALKSTAILGEIPVYESHGKADRSGSEIGPYRGSRDPFEVPRFEVLVASKPLPGLR